jgi:hypothetical protein
MPAAPTVAVDCRNPRRSTEDLGLVAESVVDGLAFEFGEVVMDGGTFRGVEIGGKAYLERNLETSEVIRL